MGRENIILPLRGDMDSNQKIIKIHFTYCMIISVSIITLIATFKWSDLSDFTKYLSNAATLTSLVLGLVAIFYSFVANDGLSKSLGNIANVSESVNQSKNQISEYVVLTKASTDVARENTESIQRFSQDITGTLSSLRSALDEIKNETANLNSSVTSIPDRFDKLESKVSQLGEKPNSSTASGAQSIHDDTVKRFLEVSSLTGNLFSYACVLANQKSKNISIADFCAATEIRLDSFLSGFMQCMHGINLIRRVEVEGEPRTYRIKFCNSYLIKNTREYFVRYINDNYSEGSDDNNLWTERLRKVDELFSEQSVS
ncbi:hypothetical protein [Burkholderia sp. AU28863]|uniref:hypothetical protein n=1 Tax=Burkholderia sp. AU28863 TaxID=2015352 RepID=UPI001C530539|nr:hypothetical protein [Burkholderia sp. AU28863]